MGNFDPDFAGTVAELDAKLHEKDVELQALRGKYDRLCRRFRDNLGTLSTLFAAQARKTVQPDLCRKCISCLMGACDLNEVGDDLVSMSIYLPALAKALVSGLDSRVRLATSVDPDLLVDFRRANCIGLIYAEAAANSLKHAFPGLASGSVYATLRGHGARLELTVVDCGLGFDPEAAAKEGAEGLDFMRSLARQIDGDLRIRTSPTGTTVFLSCPA
ncbi:ATP-binding protein [Methylocystis sp. S23]